MLLYVALSMTMFAKRKDDEAKEKKSAHFSVRCHMSPLTSICLKVNNLSVLRMKTKFCGWKLGLKKCILRWDNLRLRTMLQRNKESRNKSDVDSDDETRLDWMKCLMGSPTRFFPRFFSFPSLWILYPPCFSFSFNGVL